MARFILTILVFFFSLPAIADGEKRSVADVESHIWSVIESSRPDLQAEPDIEELVPLLAEYYQQQLVDFDLNEQQLQWYYDSLTFRFIEQSGIVALRYFRDVEGGWKESSEIQRRSLQMVTDRGLTHNATEELIVGVVRDALPIVEEEIFHLLKIRSVYVLKQQSLDPRIYSGPEDVTIPAYETAIREYLAAAEILYELDSQLMYMEDQAKLSAKLIWYIEPWYDSVSNFDPDVFRSKLRSEFEKAFATDVALTPSISDGLNLQIFAIVRQLLFDRGLPHVEYSENLSFEKNPQEFFPVSNILFEIVAHEK